MSVLLASSVEMHRMVVFLFVLTFKESRYPVIDHPTHETLFQKEGSHKREIKIIINEDSSSECFKDISQNLDILF
jgi:hypothetical protein